MGRAKAIHFTIESCDGEGNSFVIFGLQVGDDDGTAAFESLLDPEDARELAHKLVGAAEEADRHDREWHEAGPTPAGVACGCEGCLRRRALAAPQPDNARSLP